MAARDRWPSPREGYRTRLIGRLRPVRSRPSGRVRCRSPVFPQLARGLTCAAGWNRLVVLTWAGQGRPGGAGRFTTVKRRRRVPASGPRTAQLVAPCWSSPGCETSAAGQGRHADVAQLVEHDLAKVGVAGSNPVVRSETVTTCPGGSPRPSRGERESGPGLPGAAVALSSSSGWWNGRHARFRPWWLERVMRVQISPRTRIIRRIRLVRSMAPPC